MSINKVLLEHSLEKLSFPRAETIWFSKTKYLVFGFLLKNKPKSADPVEMQIGQLRQIKLESGYFPNYTNTSFPPAHPGHSFSGVLFFVSVQTMDVWV